MKEMSQGVGTTTAKGDNTDQGMRTPDIAGFSLVEIAIVVTIIALLVSAILVGRDLVRAAEFRKFHQQFQQYLTAVRTFEATYACLPGDCARATDLFGEDPETCPPPDGSATPNSHACNGNGDGTLYCCVGDQVNEDMEAWRHLANAGYIGGTYTSARTTPVLLLVGMRVGFNCPATTLRPNSCWRWESSGEMLGAFPAAWTGVTSLSQSSAMWVMTPADAFIFDSKYDDGLAGSGNICSYDSCISTFFTISPQCSIDAGDGTRRYNSENSSVAGQQRCGVAFGTGLYRR